MNKSSSGIKGFILFYTLGSIMSESPGRNLETKIEAKAMLLALNGWFILCLIHPRTTSLGLVLLTVGCGLPC